MFNTKPSSTPIESLEPRRYASQTPYLDDGGTLVVTGTRRNEAITVDTDGAGRITAVVRVGRKVMAAARFKPSQVKALAIDGAAGRDTITVRAEGISESVIHGGGGNDLVFAVGSNLKIHGDAGDDRVTAEASINAETNFLFGGAGRDRLTAGAGSFELDGGDGNDILFHAGWAPAFDTPVRSDRKGLLIETVLHAFRTEDGEATLKGGAGNDLIYAASNDGVWGGGGRDHLLFDMTTPGKKKPRATYDPQNVLVERMGAYEIEVTQITVR